MGRGETRDGVIQLEKARARRSFRAILAFREWAKKSYRSMSDVLSSYWYHRLI